MDNEDYASPVSDISDHGEEDNEFDSVQTSASKSKLQSRSVTLKARWVNEMNMAELVETKGNLWRTTGILRNGKTYLFIEEIIFLAQIGALHLLDDNDSYLSKNEIYEKVANKKNGSCWEHFEAYRHLKCLGYIVKRHGIPWSIKTTKDVNLKSESVSVQGTPEGTGLVIRESNDKSSIIDLFNNMQVNEVKLVFDVYLPNRNFKKSAPGDPSYIICFTSGSPPSQADIELLDKRCGSTPLKFCHTDYGRVSFFSFDRVQLPLLP